MSGAVMSGPDTMRLARDERVDLADFLATLTPEQWNARTLCTLWRVRDVVAHMFSYEDLGLLALRLAATDLDWNTGDGPTVEGPGEALLMAMAGGPAALPELSGPGTATLTERITSSTVD